VGGRTRSARPGRGGGAAVGNRGGGGAGADPRRSWMMAARARWHAGEAAAVEAAAGQPAQAVMAAKARRPQARGPMVARTPRARRSAGVRQRRGEGRP
jgi:hypothetical protein